MKTRVGEMEEIREGEQVSQRRRKRRETNEKARRRKGRGNEERTSVSLNLHLKLASPFLASAIVSVVPSPLCAATSPSR